MAEELNPHETRVLGVLIEKAFTTPDHYPLTINATTNGCNQKSNRSPVFDFSEAEVVVALQGLRMKHLAGSSFPAGSRVEKWRHSAQEHWSLDDPQLAVLTELMLRGPQTKGELRTRASRMRTIASLDELGQVLSKLTEKGFVKSLPPAAGSRAERFGQTVAPRLALDEADEPGAATATGSAEDGAPSTGSRPTAAQGAPRAEDAGLAARVEALEGRVDELRALIVDLAGRLGESIG